MPKMPRKTAKPLLALPEGLARPWDAKRRAKVKAAIDKEAMKVANRLGAYSVMIVASFIDDIDDATLHLQDGGQTPMPPLELYRQMIKTHEAAREAQEDHDTPN